MNLIPNSREIFFLDIVSMNKFFADLLSLRAQRSNLVVRTPTLPSRRDCFAALAMTLLKINARLNKFIKVFPIVKTKNRDF